MPAIGSVFLGDFQRHLMISSTPPSSPPPGNNGNTMSIAVASFQPPEDALDSVDDTESPHASPNASDSASFTPPLNQAPATIDPALSLELRLRWLEALLLGVRQDSRDRKGKDKLSELKPGESLVHLAEDVQHRLNAVVESNDGLKKFMIQCTSRFERSLVCPLCSSYSHIMIVDQYAQLLTPAFALSGTRPGPAPTDEKMSVEEVEALLAEMEPDIRAADRDMREIELLEQKGVLSAGKLAGASHSPVRV
jgi:hypothetical protein